jgi:hypothetical protein
MEWPDRMIHWICVAVVSVCAIRGYMAFADDVDGELAGVLLARIHRSSGWVSEIRARWPDGRSVGRCAGLIGGWLGGWRLRGAV